ncbi:MAG: hypothetical protein ACMUHM_03150 [Thermoplasmatota archaeon]
MKAVYMLGLAALVIGAGLLAGCVEEVADPDLTFSVVEVRTNATSPNPNGESADPGHHWLYVKVKVNNLNERNDLTVFPGTFYADDNVTEYTGEYLANGSSIRRIDSIRIDPNTNKEFWVIFGQIPDGDKMVFIRYRGTLDEPVEKKLPDY